MHTNGVRKKVTDDIKSQSSVAPIEKNRIEYVRGEMYTSTKQ